MAAPIDWSDQSVPFTLLFDGLYSETNHASDALQDTFIKENQLINRWLTCQKTSFCIAEIGFGKGLNFLLTCLNFTKFLQENPEKPLKKLFFSSFEKSPLTQQALQNALKEWPMLTSYIKPLLAQYPLLLTGCHRLHFHNISLDLWWGDVQKTLANVYIYQDGLFDYWYLNTFSASINAQIYHHKLFKLIALSSKQGASLLTLNTSDVTQNSLQNAAFQIKKYTSDNKKCELLVAKLHLASKPTAHAQHYRASKNTLNKDIAIIGGGLSSACLSLALIKRGFTVTLYCKDRQLGMGASGNQQAALYPLLNAQHNALSQFFANSFLYARHYVQQINRNQPFDFDFSGLLQLYYDSHASKKLDKILAASLPTSLVKKITTEQTDKLAGIDIGQEALFYPLAGWLSPAQMITAIFSQAQQSGRLKVNLNHCLASFEAHPRGWLCDFGDKKNLHSTLVLTTAMHTLDFTQCEALPLSAARGQVTHIKSNKILQKLNITLCHEGYLTPPNNGFHCMGATFKRHNINEQFSAQEQVDNKAKLAKCIKDKPWIEQIDTDHKNANVGIRCTTRDHFPYLGAVPNYLKTKQLYQHAQKKMPTENAPFHDNLFILTGLGSRGFNTGPLLAETLASQINQEPLPLTKSILNAMQCNRQWINYLKKGKTLHF